MFAAYSAIAILAIVAELIWPAKEKPFFRRGLFTDGLYVAVNIGIRIVFTNTIAIAFTQIGTRYVSDWVPVATLSDQPVWLQAIAVILVLDFFFYWMHRAKHHWDWWYRLHETHHSSRDLDWFSSVRFHPLEKILDRLIYLFPLMVLGVGEEALLILSIVDAGIATFAHANIRLRLGPLNYIIVGPELHRWHHARLDGQTINFGNNLAIFDWLFGTARLPADRPKEFGLQDRSFPEGNIVKQFTFAFRPMPKGEPGGGDRRAEAPLRAP